MSTLARSRSESIARSSGTEGGAGEGDSGPGGDYGSDKENFLGPGCSVSKSLLPRSLSSSGGREEESGSKTCGGTQKTSCSIQLDSPESRTLPKGRTFVT